LARRCPKCGESKDLEEFAVRSSGGVQSWCRVCTAEASALWRARRRVTEAGMRNYHHARCIVCGNGFSTHISAQVTCSEACREEFAGAHQRAWRKGARG
jgi:predicted nucleic acid-binding Zn ribbon protein